MGSLKTSTKLTNFYLDWPGKKQSKITKTKNEWGDINQSSRNKTYDKKYYKQMYIGTLDSLVEMDRFLGTNYWN